MLVSFSGIIAANDQVPSVERERQGPTAEALAHFESKIRPVLAERCYSCHSAKAKEIQGGLRLDTREGVLKGGDSGPAIVPGEVDDSLLIAAIRYEKHEMPPDGKLSPEVIAEFEAWIRLGAADPRESTGPAAPSEIDIARRLPFWSFQRPHNHPLPMVQQVAWPQQRIDWFVLAAMEQHQLTPNGAVDRRTLVRRIAFDLTGLPPTLEDLDALVADDSQKVIADYVDHLLASPQHGERMARMWLDIARYAEDQAHIVGDDRSLCYPNAYLYRDWVIGAFNSDMPYDQFLRLQLAADLIETDRAEKQVSLGFLGLGPKYYDRKSVAVQADEWEDRVDVVSRGLLGLTVACARCHDHKYDPIPTEDYYALAGVFASTEMFNRPLDGKREVNDKGQAKKPDDALHIVREGEPRDLPLFVRGKVENPGPLVPRHFLSALSETTPQSFTVGSGRKELADAIASPQNPLTARVIVNRIWNSHFGRPLVATPSNFGTSGELPSHPELLDDLAARFIEHAWSIKWLHREIVLSATYQQSSVIQPAKLAADPENRWLSRMPRRKLSVEAWRDALLSAAGELDQTIGGPSINPLDPGARRRTVYSSVSRLELNPLLALFDFPDPNLHAEKRNETTTPLQKLFVLNSPLMSHLAESLANRLLAAPISGDSTTEQSQQVNAAELRLVLAYRWLYGRTPSEQETKLAIDYLNESSTADPQRRVRWQQLMHVLLASNELLFVD